MSCFLCSNLFISLVAASHQLFPTIGKVADCIEKNIRALAEKGCIGQRTAVDSDREAPCGYACTHSQGCILYDNASFGAKLPAFVSL